MLCKPIGSVAHVCRQCRCVVGVFTVRFLDRHKTEITASAMATAVNQSPLEPCRAMTTETTRMVAAMAT